MPPPPPPVPPPEPEPEPDAPPVLDSLTTRWVWPPASRQLLIPQVVEEPPAAFATQAAPMVAWLAAHPTEIWPQLRTLWETNAQALDSECRDDTAELSHHDHLEGAPSQPVHIRPQQLTTVNGCTYGNSTSPRTVVVEVGW